ncbi:MAG: hypothetical protein ABIX01_00025 [Chitinophagaceae bacterium]
MRRHLLPILLFSSSAALGQTPVDAIRQSYQIPQGTARNMAIGGAMGSLGGDITAAHVNPAGLGFYKTNEWIVSPGFNFINNKFDFRGTNQNDKKNNFTYGTSGVVIGWGDRWNKKKSNAFSLSINQTANFNNYVHYKGVNNVSSWSEQYLEELVKNKVDTFRALTDYIYGSTLAFRTYLIDAEFKNGQQTGYQSFVPISKGITQENTLDTKGGVHEIALGFATNAADKLYLGGSVGIPIYNYMRTQDYSETSLSTSTTDSFASFKYHETYESHGVGVNLKMGLIYKPIEKIRLGIAIHTPTFANMEDKIRSSLTTNTEGYKGTLTESSDNLNSGNPGVFKYTMTTPWKALISGSYVFNEVSDVKRQKAFITVDAEYLPHRGTQYDITQGGSDADQTYYKSVNNAIDDRYKGTFNFRMGGEVKFTTVMARAGFAYYGNPYKDKELLKNNRMLLSGGLGYRNKGIFVDLTYVHSIMRDTHIPYYLTDRPNTFAEGKNTKGNVMLTFGAKF